MRLLWEVEPFFLISAILARLLLSRVTEETWFRVPRHIVTTRPRCLSTLEYLHIVIWIMYDHHSSCMLLIAVAPMPYLPSLFSYCSKMRKTPTQFMVALLTSKLNTSTTTRKLMCTRLIACCDFGMSPFRPWLLLNFHCCNLHLWKYV